MDRDTDEEGWWGFLELLAKLQDVNQLDEFSQLFFTPEERMNLAKRFQIVKALMAEEESQREIAKHYKLSIAKITRGSNALKEISTKLREFLSKNM